MSELSITKEKTEKLFKRFFSSKYVIWIKDRLTIFCKYTCTHAVQYLIDKTFGKYERLFWFIAFLISSIAAIILLWYSLYLSADTPTVTVVETTHFPTYRIPFPGVTICNVNKISKKAIMALAREL